jgi:hypothetical protein
MKINKFFTILVFVILLVGIAIWAPFEGIDLSISGLFGVEKSNQISSLRVISLKDSIRVYLDGEQRGETSPEGGVLEIPDVVPGTHIIKLEKVADVEDSQSGYFEFVKSIDFLDSYSVVLAYELGPSAEFSQGHVLLAQNTTQKGDENQTRLNIDVVNTPAEVFIDGNSIGMTPIKNYPISLSSIHDLKFEKDGYENLEFTILPESEEDRKKLSEVDLYLETRLFQIPLIIE